jgi:hypothetical protein
LKMEVLISALDGCSYPKSKSQLSISTFFYLMFMQLFLLFFNSNIGFKR